MNIEEFRNICLSLPMVTEDTPFDETTVVFRLKGKIFACIATEYHDKVVLKCDPDIATELRSLYDAVQPAWHWNKKYWNDITLNGSLSDTQMLTLIHHAYAEVNRKLPKREHIEMTFDSSDFQEFIH